MNMKTLIAVAVAGALGAAFTVPASSADNDKPRATPGVKSETPAGSPTSGAPTSGATAGSSAVFNRLDRNGDGFVTRDEARDATELQGRFAELDKDNDGKLSASEMRGLDAGSSATGTTGSGSMSGSATGKGGSTGGMGGSTGPAGTSSGPNPAGEAPRGGISK